MQIAIGGLTSGLSPLEMDAVYECILNNGTYLPPHAIAKIEIPGKGKEKAKVMYEYNPKENEKKAMNENVANELKTCLQSVVKNGTAAAVKKYYNGYAAGKTGTSDENKDAWFVGFTTDKATAVWVGYDDSKTSLPAQYNQGGKVAAPIWGMYMQKIK